MKLVANRKVVIEMTEEQLEDIYKAMFDAYHGYDTFLAIKKIRDEVNA